jgi:hypothetical protein
MPEGTQRYSRTKMVLPLRVWLDERAGETPSTQWVHTIDISQIGCRLGGLRTKLSPGDPIAEDSTEPSCATEDSSATASARNTTPRFIPVAVHPCMRRGLSFGLLLLNPALALSLYNGVFYEGGLSFGLLLLGAALALSLYQGRVAIQPPVLAPPIAEDLDWDEQ